MPLTSSIRYYNQPKWLTVLDIDFTLQPANTLSPDGSYSIGGRTWTKINTANEVASCLLNNPNSGLEFAPSGGGNNMGYLNTRSCPAIMIPLMSLGVQDFSYGIRVWNNVIYDNAAANYDNTVVSLGNIGAVPSTTSYATSYSLKRGYAGGLTQSIAVMGNGASITETTRPAYAYPVGVLEVPVIGVTSARHFIGNWSGSWPAESSLIPATSVIGALCNELAGSLIMSQWYLHVGALRVSSGTAYKPRFGNIRVDICRQQ